MVKNNIEIDVKVKCLEEGVTQAQLAEMVGTSAPYVSRLINKKEGIINKVFVDMLDKLGYDIQLVYVKKGSSIMAQQYTRQSVERFILKALQSLGGSASKKAIKEEIVADDSNDITYENVFEPIQSKKEPHIFRSIWILIFA